MVVELIFLGETRVPFIKVLFDCSSAFTSESSPMSDLTLEEAASMAPLTASLRALANDLLLPPSPEVLMCSRCSAGLSTNSTSSSSARSSDLRSRISPESSRPWFG